MTEKTQELEEYANAIDSLAFNENDSIFSNKDFEHAAIVIATIFKYSNDEVIIYEDNLSGNISNYDPSCLKQPIKDFLIRGGKLKIALTEKKDKISELGKELNFYAKNFKNDVIVKYASTEMKNAIFYKESNVFFVLGDKKMLRKEEVQFEGEFIRKGEALGCFNAPKTGKKLSELFYREFENCDDYDFTS